MSDAARGMACLRVLSSRVVRPEGLEPPTGGLEIRCSILLSYGRRRRRGKARRVYYSAGDRAADQCGVA
jgi:hypothetical protein